MQNKTTSGSTNWIITFYLYALMGTLKLPSGLSWPGPSVVQQNRGHVNPVETFYLEEICPRERRSAILRFPEAGQWCHVQGLMNYRVTNWEGKTGNNLPSAKKKKKHHSGQWTAEPLLLRNTFTNEAILVSDQQINVKGHQRGLVQQLHSSSFSVPSAKGFIPRRRNYTCKKRTI